jgi:hypothetical protein
LQYNAKTLPVVRRDLRPTVTAERYLSTPLFDGWFEE